VLQHPAGRQGARLLQAIHESTDVNFATTVISLEEHLRGWLAAIHGARSVERQIVFYRELLDLISFFRRWTVLSFNERAAKTFAELRKQGVRIGSMDLKIASIVMAHNAMLLSANLRDFEKVPGLRVEDWIK
jgi:tRNA(fMet)-specific endonuclease VapC